MPVGILSCASGVLYLMLLAWLDHQGNTWWVACNMILGLSNLQEYKDWGIQHLPVTVFDVV